MAENVLVLKKKAVKAGMPKAEAMKASRKVLEDFLSNGTASKKTAKKAVKKAVTKKTAKKAAVKKTAAKKTTAKKTTAAKTTKRKKASEGGRNIIGKINFSNTDGWNPREGSAVALIFKAIKKAKGDVDKATDALLPNAKEYVSLRKKDGSKRTKAEIRDLLRYRVNRTKWEFARRTGQHNPSENRVEYGTGAYAQAKKKAARGRAAGRKIAKAATTKKKKTAKKKK